MATRHEIISRNPDVEVRFYLSEDPGSYTPPHWLPGLATTKTI